MIYHKENNFFKFYFFKVWESGIFFSLYFCDYFIQLDLFNVIAGDPSTSYVFDATGAFDIELTTYNSSKNYMYLLYQEGAKRKLPC